MRFQRQEKPIFFFFLLFHLFFGKCSWERMSQFILPNTELKSEVKIRQHLINLVIARFMKCKSNTCQNIFQPPTITVGIEAKSSIFSQGIMLFYKICLEITQVVIKARLPMVLRCGPRTYDSSCPLSLRTAWPNDQYHCVVFLKWQNSLSLNLLVTFLVSSVPAFRDGEINFPLLSFSYLPCTLHLLCNPQLH